MDFHRSPKPLTLGWCRSFIICTPLFFALVAVNKYGTISRISIHLSSFFLVVFSFSILFYLLYNNTQINTQKSFLWITPKFKESILVNKSFTRDMLTSSPTKERLLGKAKKERKNNTSFPVHHLHWYYNKLCFLAKGD